MTHSPVRPIPTDELLHIHGITGDNFEVVNWPPPGAIFPQELRYERCCETPPEERPDRVTDWLAIGAIVSLLGFWVWAVAWVWRG